MDFYGALIGSKPITSLYIGGGTPTTMLDGGLPRILENVHRVFNLRCHAHLESHPNDIDAASLARIRALGVRYLSLGVEALQDRHLRTIERPYTAARAREAVRLAMDAGFSCVNVDVMFDLPGQTDDDVSETGHALVAMGPDQIAAYPFFRFPYARMGGNGCRTDFSPSTLFRRRRMLADLERIFYAAGYERTSVWAFTRKGIPKYCSVTVPLYVGLGASGGSYLRDIFYLNTFSVAEYIRAISGRGTAFALSLGLSARMQMAGWLYWRIYETRISKGDFARRFGLDFDRVFGRQMKVLSLMGMLDDDGDRIVLTDRGNYWLHAFEDLFSIDYISELWGTSQQNPWPEAVVL
jgi:oxygen-independent coproporphyrinogen-3 oxidase